MIMFDPNVDCNCGNAKLLLFWVCLPTVIALPINSPSVFKYGNEGVISNPRNLVAEQLHLRRSTAFVVPLAVN